MKLSPTNKKILIFGAVFIAFTIIVAFVSKTGDSGSEENIITVRPFEDYEVADTASGKMLKSEGALFSLAIPEGWAVKDYGSEVNLVSSESDKLGITDIDESICRVAVEIKNYSENSQELTDFNSLIDEVASGEKGEDREFRYDLIDAGGRSFLKTTFKKDDKIIYITAKTRQGNNIYYIASGLIYSDDCINSFNEVLNTVSIASDK